MSGDEAEEQPRAGRLSDYLCLGVVSRIYRRDLVDEVIAETRSKEKRNRLLPARLVVYYVIALALFFGEAYEEVMRKMVGGLRFVSAWERHWHVPTPSALCQARQRLGEAPVRRLFERTAVPVATPATIGAWLGCWRLMAIDGVTLDVPDTPRTRPRSAVRPRGPARAARSRSCGWSGWANAARMRSSPPNWARSAPVSGNWPIPSSTTSSRECWSSSTAASTATTSSPRHGTPARTCCSGSPPACDCRSCNALPDDSYLSAITPKGISTPASWAKHGGGPRNSQAIIVRVVEYQITDRDTNGETYRLITTITDWETALAPDLAAAYHQRWEFEIALDEIETHQIAHSRVLRSKSPQMVRQEIWGILLAHYAIRTLMTEAAHDADIDPDRLSFIRSLRVIRREAEGSADFSPSPNP